MSFLSRTLVRAAPPLLAAALLSADLSAQAVEPRAPVQRTELGGRLHLQFNTTSADGEHATEYVMRRARIWAGTRINDWIDGAVQVDVSGSSAVARYAFVRFALGSDTRLSLGQFKRAFDVFELTSSADILVVERDASVRGASGCTGVGGLCSYSRFSEQLQLSSLDVGALLQGESAGGRVGWLLSVTNGAGPNRREENGAKSFSGRFELHPSKGEVTVGLNAGLHDFPNDVTGEDTYAPAAALDVEVGNFTRGFHLQAGVMTGENWLNLDAAGDGSRFLAWQGIATYRVPVEGSKRVQAVEPVGRVSWGDPDRDSATDGGLVVTPGLVVHFQGRNKLGANVDVWRPQSGHTVWGLKAQTYLYF